MTLTMGYDRSPSKRTDPHALFMFNKTTDLSSGTPFTVGSRHTF